MSRTHHRHPQNGTITVNFLNFVKNSISSTVEWENESKNWNKFEYFFKRILLFKKIIELVWCWLIWNSIKFIHSILNGAKFMKLKNRFRKFEAIAIRNCNWNEIPNFMLKLFKAMCFKVFWEISFRLNLKRIFFLLFGAIYLTYIMCN